MTKKTAKKSKKKPKKSKEMSKKKSEDEHEWHSNCVNRCKRIVDAFHESEYARKRTLRRLKKRHKLIVSEKNGEIKETEETACWPSGCEKDINCKFSLPHYDSGTSTDCIRYGTVQLHSD